MCDFCKASFIGEEEMKEFNDSKYPIEHFIDDSHLYTYFGGHKVVTEIKFCPFCGEKL